jgi:hypothetical protein
MTTMSVVTPAKLPLWRTIGQAYALWAENFPDLVRVVWLWMLLTAPVLAVFFWWREPHLLEMMQAARAGERFADPSPWLTLVTQIVGQVILLPALASAAVAWHRLLLRDEHAGPGIYLRLDSIVAGYAILAFWIGVITLAPGYLGQMVQIIIGASATKGIPAAVAASIVQMLLGVATIIVFFIGARLSLALPGVALGRDEVTLGSAWRISKRNTWRMVWAYFFCSLPGAAIAGGISFGVFLSDPGRATGTLALLVMSLLWIPVGMISVGMLSLAYRHFFERDA